MNPTRPAGRLDGRVAIVTGASRGLGAAIAAAFAAEGAAVAVAARTSRSIDDRLPGSVHTVVEAITRQGGRATAVQCDVSEDGDLVRLVDQVRSAWGPISLLVNNAAVTVPGRPGQPSAPVTVTAPSPANALAMPAKGLRRHLEVNVLIAVNALLPSAPIDTPGLRATTRSAIATVPITGFAEAAVQLALASAETFTGQVAYHEDVLHPELGKRGWMAAT